jgi:hypothetical protein
VVLLSISIYLYNQYDELIELIEDIQVNYLFILLAALLVINTILVGTFTWWSILSWFNHKKLWFNVARGYTLSALGKYIPGFFWHYGGRSFVFYNLSVPIKVIGAGIVLELIISTMVGLLLACISYLFLGSHILYKTSSGNLLSFLITILILFLLLILPNSFQMFVNKITVGHHSFKPKYYFFSIISNLCGWVLMSLAYWLIISSLEIQTISFLFSMFLHTTSFVAGSIILPIPNGLIIRELTLVLLGSTEINANFLIISSVFFRIIILVGETLIAVALSLMHNIKKN